MYRMAIAQRWTMDSSDILHVGVTLGYKWIDINAEVSKEGLHGQDGSGKVTMEKCELEELDSEPLKVIFRHIFATYKDMEEVVIIDDN